MSEDLCQRPMREQMLNGPQTRATQYRRQAAELRGMAENQINESELRDLAAKYGEASNG